mmetsp:Transcript_25082/g.49976  ORF Transcript_25082/g.49976 Transcript_25082/m.49976 type:complete len:922 (+) Transcript_25082:803-3568(+)
MTTREKAGKGSERGGTRREEDEDEDKGDQNLTVPTTFQNAILLLLKHGRISKEAATALLTAMAQGNTVLQTIYKAFTVNKDAATFLSMIVALVNPSKDEAGKEPAPAKPTQDGVEEEEEEQEQVSKEEKDELMERFDAVFEQCLQIMLAREMVTREGCETLISYSRNNLPELMGLLEDFNKEGDIEKLLNVLKQIAEAELAKAGATAPAQAPAAPDPDTTELDKQLIKVLAQCIDVMLTRKQISHEGARILLDMAKSKEPILLAHLTKAFESDMSLELMLEDLSKLADEELKLRKPKGGQGEGGGDEEAEEATLEKQVDDNLMKVLSQIIHILTSNDVIDEGGAKVLILLGKAKSPILMAALSRFHETNDLAELFETLHMLAVEGDKMLKGESGDNDDDDDDDDGDDEDEDEYNNDQFDDYDSSEGENDKVQPMTWVERRRSLSMESMGDMASNAATLSSQAGQSYQNVTENEEDSEDEDDGPTLEMLTHPSTLSHLIVMLHDAGLASVAERAVLLKLAENGDPRCLAAFDVYRDMLTAIEGDKDSSEEKLNEQRETALDDLVDTCMRICKRELQQGPYDRRHSSFALGPEGVIQLAPKDKDDDDDDEGGISREKVNKEEDGIELRTFSESFDAAADEADGLVGAGPGHKDERSEEGAAGGSVFSQSDRMQVVQMMVANGVLSDDEGVVLEVLVEKKNRSVDDAFEAYENDKDVMELSISMKKIAKTAGDYLVSQGLEGVPKAPAAPDPEAAAYDVFFSYVEAMDLGDIETAALRLCIARGDPALKASLEAFRITENGTDLQDTLRKIIRSTIEGVDAGQNVQQTRAAESAALQRERQAEQQQPQNAGDAEKFTDMERRYIITMLISELSKQDIITAVQGSDLLSKYNAGDAEITDALDVYERERSMESFVATLKTVADRG